ncbi:MAG: LacI family DNA-binding transcriptional regulator [Verrucomicrobiota bacterium]|nr:LacI family DNA-binding transcriptional regulator [Verrucomicrobiota bacterium]
MKNRPSRLKDIAAKLNLSTATVSLALRNQGRMAESTRKQILALAEALDYQANPLVAQMAANRWKPLENHPDTSLAFIRVDKLRRAKGHPWESMFAGARDEATKRGYKLDAFNLLDYPSSQALDRVLFNRGIKGLLLGRIYDETPRLKFNWDHYSVISCGSSVYKLPHHGVEPNYFTIIEQAWDRLWKLGYRRIGVVLYNLPKPIHDDILRMGAVLACQQMIKPEHVVPPLFLEPPLSPEPIVFWYAKHSPDAIIGLNSYVWQALTQNTVWRCPQDFAYLSLFVDEGEPLSGFPAMDVRLGRAGVELLLALIKLNLRGATRLPMWHELAPDWVDKGTCPRKRR